MLPHSVSREQLHGKARAKLLSAMHAEMPDPSKRGVVLLQVLSSQTRMKPRTASSRAGRRSVPRLCQRRGNALQVREGMCSTVGAICSPLPPSLCLPRQASYFFYLIGGGEEGGWGGIHLRHERGERGKAF